MTTSVNTKNAFDSQTKGVNPKDGADFDLYAELFAAFFPVQVPAAAVAPAPAAEQPAEGMSAEQPFGETLAAAAPDSNADAPHLLPTGASIAADAEEFLATKRAPELVPIKPGDDSILPPPAGLDGKLAQTQPDPIKLPIGKSLTKQFAPAGPSDRMRDIPPDVTCSMPTRGSKAMGVLTEPTSVTLPETGDHAPIDVMAPADAVKVVGVDLPEKGDHSPIDVYMVGDQDAPIKIEVLQVPTVQSPTKHSSSVRDAALLIDTPPVPAADPGLSAATDVPPFISAVPAAVAYRRHTPNEFSSSFRTERLDINDKPGERKGSQRQTLLEAFTNRVLADARSANVVRTMAKENADLDATSPVFAQSLAESEQPDAGADFSFDTSVGGDARFAKVEKPEMSDSKMRRIIFDQVGSHLSDMAAAQKPGEKQVLTLKLSPAELGGVEITLSKNADGVIDAHFRTDNPQAQHAINETLALLRESLERSGMQVGNLNTSCNSSSSNNHGGAGGRETKHFTAAMNPATAAKSISSKKSDDGADRLVSLRA